jgi:lathosterol oxidase
MLMLFLEFLACFAFILILGYLLPAGHFYYKYHLRPDPNHERHPIQERRPTPDQIRREIKLSVQTVAIFAVGATILLELYKAGMTSIYRPFYAYPLYFPISIVLSALIHDTYFYWTHRFMHWQPVFKYIHVGHHKSVSPTPWAIYAFQPLEAVIQFLGIMLLVILLPLSPFALFVFLCYDSFVNTAGHTGYEIVPKWISQNRFLAGFNTVTHHDSHHTNMRVNFGSFFNVWDRIMGTFQDDAVQTRPDPVPSTIAPRKRKATGLPSRGASTGRERGSSKPGKPTFPGVRPMPRRKFA